MSSKSCKKCMPTQRFVIGCQLLAVKKKHLWEYKGTAVNKFVYKLLCVKLYVFVFICKKQYGNKISLNYGEIVQNGRKQQQQRLLVSRIFIYDFIDGYIYMNMYFVVRLEWYERTWCDFVERVFWLICM